MARPRNDVEDERERLVELACSLIVERGSRVLTIQDLAAHARQSPAAVSRHFESRDALFEAVAEYWFRPKVAVMDEVVASELPARRKMYEFFARRFVMIRDAWRADPTAHQTYMELGDEYFEQVRSYVDLADHYLGVIIGEAMGEGFFVGLDVDETISLVNQMVAPYCSLTTMSQLMERLTEDKLARIIDAVFDGLSAQDRGAKGMTGLRAA
ncbi:TetR/AcrR family transcriptional regulator [Novosphingobium sp. FKTRR1]|uniref:TetR/AcrR family transcriptional regulator n=1 Tax=unclassified Novosphingobium TaxID=2644732 RepID=UPI001CF0A7E4|nr:TetR/AcrR family transcriptional regulator [Novosphingobium sp. FKTRR1]